MNNARTNRQQAVRPIRFHKLLVGSTFNIFAEPSRDIRKSNDKTVYFKDCEAYSTDTTDAEHCIILMPEDLVVPLTRGEG